MKTKIPKLTIEEQNQLGITNFITKIIKEELSKFPEESPYLLKYLNDYITERDKIIDKSKKIINVVSNKRNKKKEEFIISEMIYNYRNRKNRRKLSISEICKIYGFSNRYCKLLYKRAYARHSKVKDLIIPEVNTPSRIITVDILEGLTDSQKNIVTRFVERYGYNPLGFTVYTDIDEIYYMGVKVA